MAKVMVSLPSEFLKQVDRVAKRQHRSRSELIREALRAVLADRTDRAVSWQSALAPLRDLERQWIGGWDSTDIVRYYRDRRHGRENRR
jgi:Arc/MetJ-type ribon-helix-helix transcriptional regulator